MIFPNIYPWNLDETENSLPRIQLQAQSLTAEMILCHLIQISEYNQIGLALDSGSGVSQACQWYCVLDITDNLSRVTMG